MWFLIGLLVVVLAVALLKPPPTSQPEATEGERNIAKVEEGDQLGRVYGTAWIMDPQVHWYGDGGNEPIRKKGGKK